MIMKNSAKWSWGTFNNYLVCSYCHFFIMGEPSDPHDAAYSFGCKLRQNENKEYARVIIGSQEPGLNNINRLIRVYRKEGVEAVDGDRGCDRFESSGLPAYPAAYDALSKRNPVFSSVPVGPKADEQGFGFQDKILKFLPPENIVPENKIQEENIKKRKRS